jgi:hypothetical protein
MAMNAPLLANEVIGLDTGLILAVLIGAGFGFALERGGFGSSRKLAAQFYLHDMTVFKVMFTAILTAMIGLFGLAKLGYVDLSMIYINETYIWPQLLGGFLLGIGFIISGYCPGTSIVAAASGKLDGLVTVAGVVIGIFLFGVTYTPAVQAFHTSGYFGRVLLSDLVGLEPTTLALLITMGAVGCFFFAHWVEGKFSHLSEDVTPTRIPRIRYAAFTMLVVAAVLFALPFTPYEPVAEASVTPVVATVSPVELASTIVEGDRTVSILDVREDIADGEAFPGAVPAVRDEVSGEILWNDMLMSHLEYVIVTDTGEVEGLEVPEGIRVSLLQNGYQGWQSEILTKPELATNATQQDREQFELKSALYAYFTGAALERPKATAPLPTFKPQGGKRKKPTGGC